MIKKFKNTFKDNWIKNAMGTLNIGIVLMILSVALVVGMGTAMATTGDGDGTMVVSPTTAIAGSTTNVFTFTFTNTGSSTLRGATIVVPTGWTAPSTITSNAGYVRTTGSPTCPVSYISTSGQTITIAMTSSCTNGKTFSLIYGGTGTPKVTAPPTTGSNTFTTKTKINYGTYTPITIQPMVTVNNPVPTTTSISPNPKNVGDPTFTMTVTGTNFVSGSIVKIDTTSLTTTYVSSTSLTASIDSSYMVSAGTHSITVFNPTPGGGTSNAQTFTVSEVTKLGQTITFDTITGKTYGNAPFTVTASSDSGLTVSFAASGDCTVAVDLVSITGAGSCTVIANQSGNATYNPASDVSQTFSIAKAPATMTLGNLAQEYDGSVKLASVTTSPLVSSQ